MTNLRNLLVIVVQIMLATVIANAQGGVDTLKHFEKGLLSFDYPANWKLVDSSTKDEQHVTIARGNDAKIDVIVQQGMVARCDFRTESQRLSDALLPPLGLQIHATTPLQISPAKTSLGKLDVDGTRLHGRITGKRVTADVYSLRLNRSFVSMVYLRPDNDARANSTWETIRQTLVLKPGVLMVYGGSPATDSPRTITEGTMNGKAVRLVQPSYPAIARQAHASGTIVVQVIIDELGDVISARAISGHPLLQAVSVAAAQASKFSPTKLCGEPVRVTGVIQYNFVAQ